MKTGGYSIIPITYNGVKLDLTVSGDNPIDSVVIDKIIRCLELGKGVKFENLYLATHPVLQSEVLTAPRFVDNEDITSIVFTAVYPTANGTIQEFVVTFIKNKQSNTATLSYVAA